MTVGEGGCSGWLFGGFEVEDLHPDLLVGLGAAQYAARSVRCGTVPVGIAFAGAEQ